MKLFLVAGEASGDQLGAKLIRALRDRIPEAEFLGVGGEAMTREGFSSLFPMSDISVMGVIPVIAHLPTILRRIDETARAVVAARPDALILIDAPDFTHRVARRARKLLPDLKVADYVSPTVWAWRPWRAKTMRKSIDLVLALLPFEPEAHERLGGPRCLYVGHPLIERLVELSGDDASKSSGPVLVLPGSRRPSRRPASRSRLRAARRRAGGGANSRRNSDLAGQAAPGGRRGREICGFSFGARRSRRFRHGDAGAGPVAHADRRRLSRAEIRGIYRPAPDQSYHSCPAQPDSRPQRFSGVFSGRRGACAAGRRHGRNHRRRRAKATSIGRTGKAEQSDAVAGRNEAKRKGS